MNKLLLSAAALTAALAITGCSPSGSGQYSRDVVYEAVEQAPEGTYVTTYTYAPNAWHYEKATKTLNGMPFSEINDRRVESGAEVYTLTTWDGASASFRKCATTYDTYYREVKFEVYDLSGPGDNTGVLAESTEWEYNENGLSKITHRVTGGATTIKSDYDYTQNTPNVSYPYVTYLQSVDGGTPVKMCNYIQKCAYDYNGNRYIFEYTLYKGWQSESSRGTEIEKQSNYTSSGLTSQYTMYKLDEVSGVGSTTNVTLKLKTITLNY